MSLTGVNLQVMDVCEIIAIDKTTGTTMFSGFTTKSAIDQKTEKLDIYAGIGNNKITSLKSKKEITLDLSIANFNLDFLASINGVALDKTTTGTYFMNVSFPISTLAATITNATRILAVRNPVTGDFLKIVSGSPATISEVKVAGTTLTFYTGFVPTTCLVSYAAPATKDNYTIVFNGKSFPKNAEFLLHTVAYDQQTESIVADVNINFYSGAISPDFTWSFEVGKAITTDVKVDVIMPANLPDGTVNTAGDIGKMTVTER